MQEHIGQIRDMRVDLYRTSLAPSGDEFVFDVEGIAALDACMPLRSVTAPNARS
nr:hypothetical protein [Xanthomonas vasicola]